MTEPIFWLVCSFLWVAVCLTAVLVTAIPALRELARASRSAEKLFDTLYRELPPTLEAIRLTGSEISHLTDDLSGGVESAGNVVKQVDQGLRIAQRQTKAAGITTQTLWVGAKAAWKSLTKPHRSQRRPRKYEPSPESDRLVIKGDRPSQRSPRTKKAPTRDFPLEPLPEHISSSEPDASPSSPTE